MCMLRDIFTDLHELNFCFGENWLSRFCCMFTELTLGIRRMHEAFVALAARLQAVHSQVEAQKEQYLNLRKYVLKDPTNVFEDSNG